MLGRVAWGLRGVSVRGLGGGLFGRGELTRSYTPLLTSTPPLLPLLTSTPLSLSTTAPITSFSPLPQPHSLPVRHFTQPTSTKLKLLKKIPGVLNDFSVDNHEKVSRGLMKMFEKNPQELSEIEKYLKEMEQVGLEMSYPLQRYLYRMAPMDRKVLDYFLSFDQINPEIHRFALGKKANLYWSEGMPKDAKKSAAELFSHSYWFETVHLNEVFYTHYIREKVRQKVTIYPYQIMRDFCEEFWFDMPVALEKERKSEEDIYESTLPRQCVDGLLRTMFREFVAYPRRGQDVRQILSMAARYTEKEKKKKLKITQLGYEQPVYKGVWTEKHDVIFNQYMNSAKLRSRSKEKRDEAEAWYRSSGGFPGVGTENQVKDFINSGYSLRKYGADLPLIIKTFKYLEAQKPPTFAQDVAELMEQLVNFRDKSWLSFRTKAPQAVLKGMTLLTQTCQLDLLLKVWHFVAQRGEIKLDTRMANCVLQAYVNLYKYDEAHDWYLMMKDDARIHPNIVSFHTIARAFAKDPSRDKQTKNILEDCQRFQRFKHSAVNLEVQVMLIQQRFKDANKLLSDLDSSQWLTLTPSRLLTIAKTFTEKHMNVTALRVLDTYLQQNYPKDATYYKVDLKVSSSVGNEERAEDAVVGLLEGGVVDGESYADVVDHFLKRDDFGAAVAVAEKLETMLKPAQHSTQYFSTKIKLLKYAGGYTPEKEEELLGYFKSGNKSSLERETLYQTLLVYNMWFGEKEGAEKLLERVGEWNLEGFEKVKMVKGLGVGCSKVGVEGMGVVLDWAKKNDIHLPLQSFLKMLSSLMRKNEGGDLSGLGNMLQYLQDYAVEQETEPSKNKQLKKELEMALLLQNTISSAQKQAAEDQQTQNPFDQPCFLGFEKQINFSRTDFAEKTVREAGKLLEEAWGVAAEEKKGLKWAGEMEEGEGEGEEGVEGGEEGEGLGLPSPLVLYFYCQCMRLCGKEGAGWAAVSKSLSQGERRPEMKGALYLLLQSAQSEKNMELFNTISDTARECGYFLPPIPLKGE